MSFELQFLPSALKEWEKLDRPIRDMFLDRLKDRLISPHVPSARLRGLPGHYKIKLRSSGFRLVYRVEDARVVVVVVAVGKRDKGTVYDRATRRR